MNGRSEKVKAVKKPTPFASTIKNCASRQPVKIPSHIPSLRENKI